MRPTFILPVLLVVAFAGCISDDPSGEGGTGGTGSSDPRLQPDRRFEPLLIMEAPSLELEQGQNVSIRLDLTDLHDYPYPTTFIDWNLTYNREPNPVLEGDATQVPVTYERQLFAEDWHLFTFNVDDGQGFKQSKHLLVKVGDPPELDVQIEDLELPSGDDEVQVFEYSGSVSALCAGAGAGCTESAEECVGWNEGTNNVDCWWFEVDQTVWGGSFETTGNDPDIWFYSTCAHPNSADAGSYSDTNPPPPKPVQVGSSANAGTESGTIPLWTGCIVMFEWGDPIIFGGSVGQLSMTITMDIPYDGDPWVDRDVDGICHAVEGVHAVNTDRGVDEQPDESKAKEYVHDRTPPDVVTYGRGGGTWLYEESNGIPGLQVGSSSLADETAAYQDCANPDFLVF